MASVDICGCNLLEYAANSSQGQKRLSRTLQIRHLEPAGCLCKPSHKRQALRTSFKWCFTNAGFDQFYFHHLMQVNYHNIECMMSAPKKFLEDIYVTITVTIIEIHWPEGQLLTW